MRNIKKSLTVLLLLAIVFAMNPLEFSVAAKKANITDKKATNIRVDNVSISEGDPVKISWNGTNGTVVARDGSNYIPSVFTLWVEGNNTITVDNITQNAGYSNGNNYAFEIQTKSTTMNIVAVSRGITYNITCPPKTENPSAQNLAPVNTISYLPLGQFATGTAWGTSINKFTGNNAAGLSSTGATLGAFGGYIEFDFGTEGVKNSNSHPYGVDFIVYGNAFNGNPEAASVQVSKDKKTWYELAGSRYYNDNFVFNSSNASNGYHNAYTGTKRNTNVVYTKGSDIKANLASQGNYTFTTATSWWPERSEGYPEHGSHNNTASNVQVNYNGNYISHTGITAVEDSNTNSDYAFGYADVTPNGTPNPLGTAVNPYTATTGGDGFDLEWAVNLSNGMPYAVNIGDKFRYVRVYSSVLENTGVFGETSPEICGIYKTAGAINSPSVGRTPKPISLKFGNSNQLNINIPSNNGGTVFKMVTLVNRFGTTNPVRVDLRTQPGLAVYINSVKLTEVANGRYRGYVKIPEIPGKIRVVTQKNNRAPYIFTII